MIDTTAPIHYRSVVFVFIWSAFMVCIAKVNEHFWDRMPIPILGGAGYPPEFWKIALFWVVGGWILLGLELWRENQAR